MVSPAIAGRDLAALGLRFRHAPVPAAHPLPGGRAIALGQSASDTAASVGRVNRGDAAASTELDQRFGDAVVALVRAAMVRWSLARPPNCWAGLARGIFWSVAGWSSRAAAPSPTASPPEARVFLVAPGMHSDLQPEVGGSGAYALIMHLLGERVGMPVAEGGSGAVSAALAALRYAGA
jgi:phytoene dehydrogenase-like protein